MQVWWVFKADLISAKEKNQWTIIGVIKGEEIIKIKIINIKISYGSSSLERSEATIVSTIQRKFKSQRTTIRVGIFEDSSVERVRRNGNIKAGK